LGLPGLHKADDRKRPRPAASAVLRMREAVAVERLDEELAAAGPDLRAGAYRVEIRGTRGRGHR
jgi:hypothetical protein